MTFQEQLSSLTQDNGAIRDLRDLMKITVFQIPAMQNFFRTVYNAHHGEKIGWLGEMSRIGWAGSGCKPEYRKATNSFAEKEWSIGEWQVPLEWCYKDFESKLAEYAQRQGTDIGDLRGTDLMDVVIAPALQAALTEMYWRFVWFGDKTAKNTNNSGDITAGVDVDLFKVENGLWKRLFEVAVNAPGQHTTIAANAEATYALQMSKLRTQGVATQLIEDIAASADSRILGKSGSALFVTESIRKALTSDMKKIYHEQLSWSQVESGIDGVELNGVVRAEYDGVEIIALPIWDRMLREYQWDGQKVNLPHRAFYGSTDELLVGTPANDIVSDVEIWFNQDERVVREYSTGKIGTMIGEDNLFQIAY